MKGSANHQQQGKLLEHYKNLFLTYEKAELDFPFGREMYVFKLYDKMFALMHIRKGELYISAKVDPYKIEELKESHVGIIGGYHLNKQHWVSMLPEQGVPENVILNVVKASHQLIAIKLPLKYRKEMKTVQNH